MAGKGQPAAFVDSLEMGLREVADAPQGSGLGVPAPELERPEGGAGAGRCREQGPAPGVHPEGTGATVAPVLSSAWGWVGSTAPRTVLGPHARGRWGHSRGHQGGTQETGAIREGRGYSVGQLGATPTCRNGLIGDPEGLACLLQPLHSFCRPW